VNLSFGKMSALVPLDRHANVWVMMLARALMRRTERGQGPYRPPRQAPLLHCPEKSILLAHYDPVEPYQLQVGIVA
jgi:hypothetical protein